MYKSKLQEVCQQKAWGLPEYSSTKEGPNHNPRFKATVTVNGASFDTTSLCKSLKEAQNEAAKLAFNHFTNPYPQPFLLPPNKPLSECDIPSSSGFSSESTNLNSNPGTGEALPPTIQETFQNPQVDCNASGVKDNKGFRDMQHLCKNQLQNYAQKRNLLLPIYSFEREGPPHASRFKSKVTIDGKTYESQDFFSTVKEAEHAAAKVALMSLLTHGVQEDDSVLYKNLLQELAQKEGFLPTYKTISSGLSHIPTFVTTVEIKGDNFQGEEAKTKKQAEMNAAKVAYIALKERGTNQSPKFSPGCPLPEASSSSLQLTATADLQENFRHKVPLNLNSNIIPIEYAEEDKAVDKEASEMVSVNVEVSTHHAPIPSPNPDTNLTRKRSLPSSDIVYARLRDPFPYVPSSPEEGSSSPSPPSERSSDLVTDSKIEQVAGTSTLACNKVCVYPRMPNMKLPAGVTVVSDDKWVAVRSDPSQIGN
ncbi:hypothetical protein L1049_008020 [Liquidambar formosana]|uniref:DRBM domain-containing protein n=1 Tax=Liquidambar formosana TaxID=63359 RepID=A0AAP0S5F1_LIQFO